MIDLLSPEDLRQSAAAILQEARKIIPTEIPRITVSEWAESNRTLTEGPYQGPFSFDVVPYLREMADALSPADTETREVVFMKPSRVGATVSVGENWIGATIDAFPCDMGYITSDGAMAEIQMQTRIDALINESGIGHKIGDVKKRAGQKKTMDKTVLKAFPGGSLLAGGPNSSFFKRSVGFKFLNVTEVDGFADDIGKEGDPVGLFRRRCGAFQNEYKILWESSPKLLHNSKIHRLYKEGDQRKYMVPCPHCGHLQELRWGNKDEPGGLRFEHDEDYRLVPGSVHYECECCGSHWKNEDKDLFLPDEKMGGRAKWVPTAVPRKPGVKSYSLNALYAPIGFITWEAIVMEFLEIKHNGSKPIELQVWVNTVLGQPFEDRQGRPKIETLLTQERRYNVNTLPEDAKPLFVTVGADVQADRIEAEIVAWGENAESWSIDYRIFKGDTEDESGEVWQHLREMITSEHCGFPVLLAGIDSGYRTDVVYSFAASFDRGVYPVMGMETIDGNKVYVRFIANKIGIPRIDVNTHLLKQEVYRYLKKSMHIGKSVGFCHFPAQYEREHFLRLTAEAPVPVKDLRGVMKWKWDAGSRRNEQLDARVYNLSMVHAYKLSIEMDIELDEPMSWDEFWSYIL